MAELRNTEEARKEVMVVGPEDVAKIASADGIPVNKLAEEESERLLKLEQILHEKVVGQNEAVSAVARSVRRARAGLKDPKRPIGSFIFLDQPQVINPATGPWPKPYSEMRMR